MKPGIVLVTGSGSGIGKSACLALARNGWLVFATSRREESLWELKKEAGVLPIEYVVMDVCDRLSIERAKAEVEKRTQGYGIDVLINNAGYGQFGAIEEVKDPAVRAQFETNVFGLLAVTRAFVGKMRERRKGRIINISSIAGRVSLPMMGIYCASKFAVEAVSDAMRRELSPFGIKVVVIEPGVIKTGFQDKARKHADGYMEEDSPYAQAWQRFNKYSELMQRFAPETKPVEKVILKAVNSRLPKRRYVTPIGGHLLLYLARLLPDSLLDFIFKKTIG